MSLDCVSLANAVPRVEPEELDERISGICPSARAQLWCTDCGCFGFADVGVNEPDSRPAAQNGSCQKHLDISLYWSLVLNNLLIVMNFLR